MAKKQATAEPPKALTIGQCYYVRTCRYDYVGRLASVDGPYSLTLVEAAWVSETGRLHVFLRDGRADGMEIEPYPPEHPVGLQWVDWTWWPHALFTEAA